MRNLATVIVVVSIAFAGAGVAGRNQQPSLNANNVNPAPLTAVIEKIYPKYQNNQVRVPATFSVVGAFKVEQGGSLSAMKIARSSGSPVIDRDAIEVLQAISDSRLLSPVSDLTSTTIRLDMTQMNASLSISGLASSPAEAKTKADTLKYFLNLFRLSERQRNPITSELLSLLRVSNQNSRVELKLAGTRARLAEIIGGWSNRRTS